MPNTAPPPRAHAKPSLLSRLALLAVSSLVAGLLAELTLRVWFPEIGKLRQLVVSTDDERGFAPKPNVRLPFAGVFSPLSQQIVWQTNADGLRHEGEIGRVAERFRVATYGDSETFGWSVALEDSFQRRMEAIDPRIEVLNFGVPGYNVTNVRDDLERSVPRFQPDLVIYLVNKNDFNEPVQFSPLSYSHVLLHLRFAWHFTVAKQLRLLTRDEPERLELFAREAERMTRYLEARDTPLVMGFLKWKNRESVRDHVPNARPVATSGDGHVPGAYAGSTQRFRRELVDVKAVLAGELKEDLHFTRSAHDKIAALFCQVISGEAERSCIPPGWRREALTLGTTAAAAIPQR